MEQRSSKGAHLGTRHFRGAYLSVQVNWAQNEDRTRQPALFAATLVLRGVRFSTFQRLSIFASNSTANRSGSCGLAGVRNNGQCRACDRVATRQQWALAGPEKAYFSEQRRSTLCLGALWLERQHAHARAHACAACSRGAKLPSFTDMECFREPRNGSLKRHLSRFHACTRLAWPLLGWP